MAADPSFDRKYRSYDQSFAELRVIAREPIELTGSGSSRAERSAFRALRVTYVALPLLLGLDKFFFWLADWDRYLAPAIPRFLGVPSRFALYSAASLEIFLAVGVALRPRIFADLLATWIAVVALSLLAQGQFYDIALRDLGLAAGAYALARLSHSRDRRLGYQ